MLDLRIGCESICYGFKCILLYIKPIWCCHFAEIYAGLEEGVESVHQYMCILLYVKLICCTVIFQKFYARLEEKVESVCHGYMCNIQYVKLISCIAFP